MSATTIVPPPLTWRNIKWGVVFWFVLLAAMSVVAIWWMTSVRFSFATIGMAAVIYVLYGFGITGGYHRGETHRAFKTSTWFRAFLLVLATGTIQMALHIWKSRHLWHHRRPDHPFLDPYPMCRGPLAAHFSAFLNLYVDDFSNVQDLKKDRLAMWQYRWYWPVAGIMGFLVPTALGWCWGDATGALLVTFPRLLVQYQFGAFPVNSFAHWPGVGQQVYQSESSAIQVTNRVLWFFLTLLSLGEVGGHDFHHSFPGDWRTGVERRFNPTTLMLRGLRRLGLIWGLRETAPQFIKAARQA